MRPRAPHVRPTCAPRAVTTFSTASRGALTRAGPAAWPHRIWRGNPRGGRRRAKAGRPQAARSPDSVAAAAPRPIRRSIRAKVPQTGGSGTAARTGGDDDQGDGHGGNDGERSAPGGRRQRPRPFGRGPCGRGEPTPWRPSPLPLAGGGLPLRADPAPAPSVERAADSERPSSLRAVEPPRSVPFRGSRIRR